MPFNREEFVREFNTQGYSIVPSVLSPEFIERAKADLVDAMDREEAYHRRRLGQSGDSVNPDTGMVLLCSLYGRSLVDIFDVPGFVEPFELILGEGCIVYAYTSSSMPPKGRNYSVRIHVDSPRLIPGYVTNVGATILLDDFTEENGASWLLPASHALAEVPSEAYFYRNAKRLTARAGAVWYFNARIWHAGGQNHTDRWRHAVTLNMCRPYMKQRIDVPRAMAGMDLSGISEKALQKLGFFAQVPASYDEYYAPPERRKFRQKTE